MASGSGLRVGIVGTGFIGKVHARAARAAGAEVVAVSASSAERSARAAADLGVARGVGADDLIGADDVDVVHVCTPNDRHAPQALAALRAGKHVVCEKPLATTLADALELERVAGELGRVLSVPFVYRFYPTVREARERVAAGEAGDIRLVHGSYLQDWLLEETDDNWRVDAERGGASRAFADIGSHWCDLVEFVSGHRITEVCAVLHVAVPERVTAEHREAFGAAGDGTGERRAVTTEDAATVLVRTDRGAVGSVVVSQISPGRKNRLWFELDGSRRSYVFDQEAPETLWIGGRHESAVVVRDGGSMSAAAARLAPLPAGHPQGYHDAFDAFVADTYAAIATGRTPDGLPTAADGARAAAVIDAVVRSSRDGGWTQVSAPRTASAGA